MSCGHKGTKKGYVPDPIKMLDSAMELLNAVDRIKPESWLDQFDSGPVHPYWLDRFNEETCRRYRLGWDGTKQMPCYPIRAMTGNPLGIVHRNIDDPGGPKYKYPRGVRKTELLFGVHELADSRLLVLVEGAMDVCAVREVGFDAVGSYGSVLDDKQAQQIRSLGPRLVLVAYDMDRAGLKGALEAGKALAKYGILTRRMHWNDKFKDLAEMDPETRSSTLINTLASTIYK